MDDKKKKLVPALRFSEFDGGRDNSYKKHLFKEIFLFSTGKNIKQKEASPEFKTPCIRYGELYYMYNEVIHKIINRTNLDESELCFSLGNEILLPSAGEDPLDIGSASALTLKNVAIGRTINILRPVKNNIYNQNYVAYYINEKLKKKISTLAKGSSISNVYNSDLKKLEINLPTLPEQQKIANFLSSVDKKIEQLRQKVSLLEDYKKGVMQQIFSQKIRFKDDNGEAFADWEVKKLGEVCSLNPKSKLLPNSFIYIDLESVNKGVLQKENIIYKKDAPSRAQRLLQKNDILFQTVRPYQKNNLFFYKDGDYVASTGYAQIRTKNNSKYLYQYLHTEEFVNKVLVRCTGTSYPAINSKYLAKVKVNLPSLPEQQKIANYLSSLDDKIQQSQQQLEQAQQFKKGLLQQLFV